MCSVGALARRCDVRTNYTSHLASRAALHLDLFEQPGQKRVFQHSAKPLSIAPGVLRRLRELPKSEKGGGIGIRKLGTKLFECRGSLALRFVFQDRPTDLFVSFLGNHDEVKALLRTGKYP